MVTNKLRYILCPTPKEDSALECGFQSDHRNHEWRGWDSKKERQRLVGATDAIAGASARRWSRGLVGEVPVAGAAFPSAAPELGGARDRYQLYRFRRDAYGAIP